METHATIEHRRSRIGSALRESRLRLVLAIVIVEGLLVLFGAIPWWTVLVLAAGALALYVGIGRENKHQALHEGTWIAAVSQLAVVLVPAVALVLTTLFLIVLVVAAVGALALLLLDRR
jgi:hypothetical protein